MPRVTAVPAGAVAAITAGFLLVTLVAAPAHAQRLRGTLSTTEDGIIGTGSTREARQGVAMAIAMATAPMPSAPGKTTWATHGATYRGEWAGGVAAAHRLPTCCVPFAATAGVA